MNNIAILKSCNHRHRKGRCVVQIADFSVTTENKGFRLWALADWAEARISMKENAKPSVIPASEIDGPPVILTPAVPLTPRINGASVFGVRPGSPFLYTVAATGERPMRFAADGLPDGLKLDGQSGQITGLLKKKGESKVLLRASNAKGTAARELRIVCGERIALTPPMGWISWQVWGTGVTQERMLSQARAMVQSGLQQHGWSYVNIDNIWADRRGGPLNAIQPNLKKFPDIKAMVDEIHGMGLKAGIYSSPWISGYGDVCGDTSDDPQGAWDPVKMKGQGKLGKYSLAANDVKQWVEWGFDSIKYDWYPMDIPHIQIMSQALQAAPRDLLFSISNSGVLKDAPDYAKWTNLWRCGGDNLDVWPKVNEKFNILDSWAPFAGPGHWNDPDMLLCGWMGWGPKLHASRLTPNEQYAHFTLWAMEAAPLMLSCDLEKLDDFTLSLLTNDEVIAVDQDALGKAARRVAKTGDTEVWVKELADGSKAVALFNRGRVAVPVAARWDDLQISGKQSVRDLWRQKELGIFAQQLEVPVPRHGVVLVRMRAQSLTDGR